MLVNLLESETITGSTMHIKQEAHQRHGGRDIASFTITHYNLNIYFFQANYTFS